jgi:SAM-dependent methyltransferase
MSETIVGKVRERYGAVAAGTLSGEHAGVQAVAQAFGYSAEELASLPAEANMGLSCGNPTAFASLRPGEVVVDLGCGGGLDVLLAAGKVGPTGRIVGIDMTPEMLERARANAAKQGAANVEFHQATIDRLPLADASVDCVISNCVINLAPDKPAVFREIARVLKPGGRVAVSDIALKPELPPEVGGNLLAYIGCIAGAVSFQDYERGLREAGFGSLAGLRGLVRPGGRFVLFITKRNWLMRPLIGWWWDSNLYTAAELTAALGRAGFKDVQFGAFPFWYKPLAPWGHIVEAAP